MENLDFVGFCFLVLFFIPVPCGTVPSESQRFFYARRSSGCGMAVKVLWYSPTVPAKLHDKKVAERARLRLPKEIYLLGDSGFEGLEAGAAGVVTPWKRRNGRALHWRHRQFNGLLAANRIHVEHTLASVKRLRVLQDEFRNRRQRMVDEVMAIGCTLHNFRCERRQWVVAQ